MKITMIGTGYVGLVTGTCLAEVGNDVLCLDLDKRKIQTLVSGGVTIHEPGLKPMIERNVAVGRLGFTTDIEQAVAHASLQFIAVGTPQDEDGSADMRYVLQAAHNIGRRMNSSKIIVNKSTVPVGTADKVRTAIAEELNARNAGIGFAVLSNPEFLKEGAAVEDFMRPDRIVIGGDDPNAIAVLRSVYAPFQRSHERMLVMDARSAELTKYASNAMLATRISFMNELANLAERLGANIESVRHGIGSDPRIGYQFLYPGVGYGGSCFPKDVRALQSTARENAVTLKLLEAVETVNEAQKQVLVEKVVARLGGEIKGRRFAVWGLAFKPDTDDMREAPSRVIIESLIGRGASIVAYDPVAMNEARRIFEASPQVSFAASPLDACNGADALVIVTEWKEFRGQDLESVRAHLKQPLVFDGRNLYEPALARAAGLEYFSIGRP